MVHTGRSASISVVRVSVAARSPWKLRDSTLESGELDAEPEPGRAEERGGVPGLRHAGAHAAEAPERAEAAGKDEPGVKTGDEAHLEERSAHGAAALGAPAGRRVGAPFDGERERASEPRPRACRRR